MSYPTSFTAIDFETAQGYRHTICQIGLVRVENGKIIHTYNSLIKPPDNYYWQQFTDEIHGIDSEMTENSPTFDKVWHLIEPYIKDQHVVAHNIAFDAGCLQATLEYYGLPVPAFTQHCTMRIFGGGLVDNCKVHYIELNHHDALSDAMACAKLFLIHLTKNHNGSK